MFVRKKLRIAGMPVSGLVEIMSTRGARHRGGLLGGRFGRGAHAVAIAALDRVDQRTRREDEHAAPSAHHNAVMPRRTSP